MDANDSSNSHGRFEASVNIFVDPTQKAQVIDTLSKVENIEEDAEVAGEFDIVSIVSASEPWKSSATSCRRKSIR